MGMNTESAWSNFNGNEYRRNTAFRINKLLHNKLCDSLGDWRNRKYLMLVLKVLLRLLSDDCGYWVMTAVVGVPLQVLGVWLQVLGILLQVLRVWLQVMGVLLLVLRVWCRYWVYYCGYWVHDCGYWVCDCRYWVDYCRHWAYYCMQRVKKRFSVYRKYIISVYIHNI